MEKVIPNLDSLRSEAQQFIHDLTPESGGATLVTLSGELGAGKTAFVKAIAEALGVTDTVTSPTFVLEKIYTLPSGSKFSKLIHIDAYRLESGEGVTSLGFTELMQDPKNLIMLEWPERVAEEVPKSSISISLLAMPDGSRTLRYG